MRTRTSIVAAAVGLALLGAIPASGATIDISVTDDAFNPTGVGGTLSELSVKWSAVAVVHKHNVHQDKGLFRSGDPQMGAWDYTRQFSAGTFLYHCDRHGAAGGVGMSGSVAFVPIQDPDDPSGLPFRVRWAYDGSNTGKAFDLRYRVNGGNWKSWKTDTAKRSAPFGVNDKPIMVKAGKTYEFQARSQKNADKPSKVSGWSPILTITT